MKKVVFASILLLGLAVAVAQESPNYNSGAESQPVTTAADQGTPQTQQGSTAAAQTPATPSSDQSMSSTPSEGASSSEEKLPQTASPLPLLLMLGLGSLGTGLVGWRRK